MASKPKRINHPVMRYIERFRSRFWRNLDTVQYPQGFTNTQPHGKGVEGRGFRSVPARSVAKPQLGIASGAPATPEGDLRPGRQVQKYERTWNVA